MTAVSTHYVRANIIMTAVSTLCVRAKHYYDWYEHTLCVGKTLLWLLWAHTVCGQNIIRTAV